MILNKMIYLYIIILANLLLSNFAFAVPGNALLPIIWPVLAQIWVILWIIWLLGYRFLSEIRKIFWKNIDITKASRLKELKSVVNVPDFFVISNKKDYVKIKDKLDESKQYIIRSSSKKEDQLNSSHAWEYVSIWPINKTQILSSLSTLLTQKDLDKIIIQEFVQWVSWVIFCFTKNNVYLEYSRVKEWVTSGKIKPFVAILPNKYEKYDVLYNNIIKIFEKNWPSDIEFINIDIPNFVQVRPITRYFSIDKNLECLKMQLQELPYECWIEDDFCKVLAERKEYDKDYLDYYLKNIISLFKNVFQKNILIKNNPFVKISNQYFVAKKFYDILRLSIIDLWILKEYYDKIKQDILNYNWNDLDKLFQYMIIISWMYELKKSKQLFELKEKYREKIYSKIKKQERKPDFISVKQLADKIEFNSEKCIWKSISYKDWKWIVVVKWKFDSSNIQIYKKDAKIKKWVLLYTDELYPQIWKNIKDLSWIICKNGAITSHISILAREYKIPLKIQAILDYEKVFKK